MQVYNFSKSLMGLHDKAFKISQRKLKMGRKIGNLGKIFILLFISKKLKTKASSPPIK